MGKCLKISQILHGGDTDRRHNKVNKKAKISKSTGESFFTPMPTSIAHISKLTCVTYSLFCWSASHCVSSYEGGFFGNFCTWMCLPDFKILTFAIPFLSPFTTQYTNFVQKKHPVLIKLGAVYHNLLKMHPIYVNRALSSVTKTPTPIPKFLKKHPKRQAHICIPCQCDNPPSPRVIPKGCKCRQCNAWLQVCGVGKKYKSMNRWMYQHVKSHPSSRPFTGWVCVVSKHSQLHKCREVVLAYVIFIKMILFSSVY